ncbi:lysosomal acid phosphatase-like [Parasteatoda tepidariorum]|uniref:lysosomal acid phosphatase-like n=1 Tax=Parasteatoda tepidariorum TaxID=114398 RepID=UPI0039BCA387
MNMDAMFNQNVVFAMLITLINVSFAANNKYKLEFVQMMYRHGDRAPQALYPTDPNSASDWPLGLGGLTALGKREHYLLGKLFRKMYEGFFTTKPTEVDAVSTDIDRCISSAQANFASFFAPTPEWKFLDDFDWQPIPITTVPNALDKYLGYPGTCPAFENAIDRIFNSPSNKAYNAKHQKLYEYLTKYTGAEINDYLGARKIYDILFIEKKYNLTIPSWVPPIFDELKDVAANAYSYIYSSKEILRLRAGPILGLVNKVFDDKMEGKAPELKFRTYSSHDVNIGAVLAALDNLPRKIINYCSTLIFELYSGSKGQYFLRLLLLNTPNIDKFNQTPEVLILPGCKEYCPYKKYLKFTNPYAHTDYEKECDRDSTEDDAISYALSV